VRIKRYLVLVVALVAMGLSTVWFKSRTVEMGYRAVELRRELRRAGERQSLTEGRIAAMTSPARAKAEALRLGLGRRIRERTSAGPERSRGDYRGRSVRLAER
jgi:hypothetical protein